MMLVLIIVVALVLLGLVAATASWLHGRQVRRKVARGEMLDDEPLPTLAQVQNMQCCGQHEVCEKESLLAAVSRQIDYYDDEELDRFQGTPSDGYKEDEVDEFREVLYTMKEVEVAGWVRSLQLRGVELPDALKDEVFLIVGERR
jgi:hypothetical protein